MKTMKHNAATMKALWDQGASVADMLRLQGSSMQKIAQECDTSIQNVSTRLLVAGRTKAEAQLRQHVPKTKNSRKLLDRVAAQCNMKVTEMWPSINGVEK